MSVTEANIADTHEGEAANRFVELATVGFCFYLYLSFVGTLPFQPRSLLLYSVTPDSDVVKQLLSLAAFGMILPALLSTSRPGYPLVPTAVVLALAWCGLTLLWSGTPWIGSRRFVYTLLSVVVVFGYARCAGPTLLLRVLASFLAAVVVLSLAAGMLVPGAVHPIDDPEVGIAGSWRGLMLHKNDAGLVAAASAIFAAARLSARPGFSSLGILLASVTLLLLSAAKTSIILLPVALLFGWLIYIIAIKTNRLVVLAVSTWVILLLAVTASLEWARIGELLEDPRAFTGRSAMWAALMAVARGAPYNFLTARLRDDLASNYPGSIDFFDASLASARYVENSGDKPFIDYLRSLFARRRLDLLIAIGAPAAGFVQNNRQALFAGIPMLLTAVEERRLDPRLLAASDVVVAFRLDLPALIENILKILPETKTIDVVIGNSPNEKFWLSQLKKEFVPFEDEVVFNWLNPFSLDEIVERVAKTSPGTAVFLGPLTVDGAGNVHQGDRTLAMLHRSANAPLFSYVDAYFGHGVVGGPQISLTDLSKSAADTAANILRGTKTDVPKVAPIEFGPPVYDWRELQRWGISESALPAGSIVEFRSPGVWERYKYYFLAAVFVTALQLFLIIGLLVNRRSLHREHVERQRAEHEAQELSGRLINAHEDERARLARELHDDVTQRLALLSIEAGHTERELAPSSRGTRLKGIREGLVRLSEDVHALSYRLHPSILVDLGLAEALKSECDQFSEFSAISVICDVDDLPDRIPEDVALCLFRIAQESLRNIARHAHATEALVSVKPAEGGLELVVRDNGQGFDQERVTKASLGQASMRQRIRHLGGNLSIESAPGKGTRLRAWVPVREEVRDAPESVAG